MTENIVLSGVSGRIDYGRGATTERFMRCAFAYTLEQMSDFEKVLTLWTDGPWAVEDVSTADDFLDSMREFTHNLDALVLSDEGSVRKDMYDSIHLHLNPFLPESHQLSEKDQRLLYEENNVKAPASF